MSTQIEYEVVVTQATGVGIQFKLPSGASDEDWVAAINELNDKLKLAVDTRQKWAEKNASPEELALMRMQKEQTEFQVENWERQKAALASAQKTRRGASDVDGKL